MKLEADVSYCVILDDTCKDNTESFAVNLVTRYIVDLNVKQGVSFGRSMFNKSLVLSDSDVPNSRTIVISRVNRKSDSFVLVNVSEHKWDLLFTLCGIDDKDSDAVKDLKKFIKVNLKNDQNIDTLFYYVLSIKQSAYNASADVFDLHKANQTLDILKGVYRNSFARTERLASLIHFIRNPTADLLFEMLRSYQENFKDIASNIQNLADGKLPKNLTTEFDETINSSLFTKNLLQVMAFLVLCENYDDFILSCLKLIRS